MSWFTLKGSLGELASIRLKSSTVLSYWKRFAEQLYQKLAYTLPIHIVFTEPPEMPYLFIPQRSEGKTLILAPVKLRSIYINSRFPHYLVLETQPPAPASLLYNYSALEVPPKTLGTTNTIPVPFTHSYSAALFLPLTYPQVSRAVIEDKYRVETTRGDDAVSELLQTLATHILVMAENSRVPISSSHVFYPSDTGRLACLFRTTSRRVPLAGLWVVRSASADDLRCRMYAPMTGVVEFEIPRRKATAFLLLNFFRELCLLVPGLTDALVEDLARRINLLTVGVASLDL